MYTKNFVFILLIFTGLNLLTSSCSRPALTETDRILDDLDRVLQQRSDYMVSKEKRIDSLRTLYFTQPPVEETYELINELLDEYQAYRYDSACR